MGLPIRRRMHRRKRMKVDAAAYWRINMLPIRRRMHRRKRMKVDAAAYWRINMLPIRRRMLRRKRTVKIAECDLSPWRGGSVKWLCVRGWISGICRLPPCGLVTKCGLLFLCVLTIRTVDRGCILLLYAFVSPRDPAVAVAFVVNEILPSFYINASELCLDVSYERVLFCVLMATQ